MRLPRRAVALAFAVLTATIVMPAGTAAAAPAARAGQVCPSMAGEILTRPGYPWYLVDRNGNLRGIPPGVPQRIFIDGVSPHIEVPLEICGVGRDLSADASIITASNEVRPWYLYTNGQKWGISCRPERYHLDGNKLQLMTASQLDLIPDGGLWC